MDSLSLDGFGYWLSGLIDGEGSFQIVPNRPGFVCRFGIGLRDDDRPVIARISERTELGKIIVQRRGYGSSNRKPLAIWRIERKDECQKLVELLDLYPLRSKKARDFSIWRQAVTGMALMPPPNGRPRNWDEIKRLKQELADVRRHPDLLDPPLEGRS